MSNSASTAPRASLLKGRLLAFAAIILVSANLRSAVTSLTPLLDGGTGTRSKELDPAVEFPESFEAGTVNAPGIIGLGAAARLINKIGIEAVVQHEQELTEKLLYSPELYWRFNYRSLLNYDIGELVNAGKEMVDRMALRRNEWRDWLGFAPDPDMDELLALENYIPADRLGDQGKLVGGGESDEG